MPISAFDLDHTLLKVNSSFEFGKFLYKKGVLSFLKMSYLAACYGGYSLKIISIPQLHELNFAILFKGQSRPLFLSYVDEFLNEHLSSLTNLPVLTALKQAKQERHFISILSSSPDFLVEAIAKRLEADHSGATIYEINAQECFASLGKVMHGQQKAEVLKHLANRLQVSKENIYAYSDSHLDIPFMEAAGNPIAVNPNRQLNSHSKRNGWRILS